MENGLPAVTGWLVHSPEAPPPGTFVPRAYFVPVTEEVLEGMGVGDAAARAS